MTQIKGLNRKIVRTKSGKSFEVLTYQCRDCGKKDDYKGDEIKCHHCGHDITKTGVLKAKPIKTNRVREILSNKVGWECPVCKKTYEKPTICCNQKFINYHGSKYAGFMCLGCKTIYTEQVKCCSGQMMIKGDIYPEMSMEEFNKVRTGLSKPVTGIIQ